VTAVFNFQNTKPVDLPGDPLKPLDEFHLQAASGWIGLGDFDSARDELAQIPLQLRAHPAVRLAHCELHFAAKEWKSLLPIAETLLQQYSELDFLWVNRSYALHELKRTQAAFDALVPAAKKFPKRWLIRYNLACYCSQLGRMDEAMQWLQDAMTLGNQDEITAMALDDPDLKPLWRKIRGI